MKLYLKFIAVIASTTFFMLSGCQQQTPEVQEATKSDATPQISTPGAKASAPTNVVAMVNGTAITEDDLNDYMARRQLTQPDMQQNAKIVLAEMINRELIKQEAINKGIDKKDEFLKESENQKTDLLVNLFLRDRLENLSFSEADIQKEYDSQVAGINSKEYKARHILSDTEEQSREIIKTLEGGADFATLAKEKSTGPSGPQGGELGWFSPASMVPAFSDAVKTMEKGSYTKDPVKTEFGWHVILLEDVKKADAPPLTESKEQIETILRNKNLQQLLVDLRAKATVELKDEASAEKSPTTESPAK